MVWRPMVHHGNNCQCHVFSKLAIMNVYFIDPTYIKDSAWEPLLSYLKVKSVYSFFTREQLSKALLDKIEPMLFAFSNGNDSKSFADKCAFWLREMIETNVKLLISDFPNGNCPNELRKNYSSMSPVYNIMNIDTPNCLVLLSSISSTYYNGSFECPSTYVNYISCDLATHLSSYCFNILHKKFNHNYYDTHTSFILFDEFFKESFRYVPKRHKWEKYHITTVSHQSFSFTKLIMAEVNRIDPENFPIYEQDGKRKLTLLRTDEGSEKYKEFINLLNESIREFNEEREREAREAAKQLDWQHEVDKMNRDFWDECGEAGSNCESWPGWG